MRLERKVNLGGFQTMSFASSEHPTIRECVLDLLAQMQPLQSTYPPVKQVMEELKRAYAVM